MILWGVNGIKRGKGSTLGAGFLSKHSGGRSPDRKDRMISYLIEDATDFMWQGAKAAHAVLMCKMERSSVTLEDQERIDQIHRAHVHSQKFWFC